MRFSDVAPVKITRINDVIWLEQATARKDMSFGLFVATTMIRNAVSYFTQHHALHRAVKDKNDNIVGIIIVLGNTFTCRSEYLDSVGFNDKLFDVRQYVKSMFINHNFIGVRSNEIQRIVWKERGHKSSRKRIRNAV